MCEIKTNKSIPQGWECPKCGRVYSPSTTMCFTCVGFTVSVPSVFSPNGTGNPNVNPTFTTSSTDSKIDLTATLKRGDVTTNTGKICDKFEPSPFNPFFCQKCGVGISNHASITPL